MSKLKIAVKFTDKIHARGVKKTLLAIQKHVATPELWIKGAESQPIKETDQYGNSRHTGEVAYCLIGAAHRVDGEFEDWSTVVIVAAIAESFLPRIGNNIIPIALDSAGASFINSEVFLDQSTDTDTIPAFNDHSLTTHKDVLKVLAASIKKCDDFIAKKKAA